MKLNKIILIIELLIYHEVCATSNNQELPLPAKIGFYIGYAMGILLPFLLVVAIIYFIQKAFKKKK